MQRRNSDTSNQADGTSDKLDFDFAAQVTATVADAVRALAC